MVDIGNSSSCVERRILPVKLSKELLRCEKNDNTNISMTRSQVNMFEVCFHLSSYLSSTIRLQT